MSELKTDQDKLMLLTKLDYKNNQIKSIINEEVNEYKSFIKSTEERHSDLFANIFQEFIFFVLLLCVKRNERVEIRLVVKSFLVVRDKSHSHVFLLYVLHDEFSFHLLFP